MTNEIESAFQIQTLNTLTHGQLYLENFDQDLYKRINNAYYGIGGFEDGSYLTQYPAESVDDFELRQEYASYDNIFQTEIDYKTNPVFGKTITREMSNARLNAFTESVNKAGDTMSKHMARLMNQAELNTTVFDVLTAPNVQITDNRDLTVLPYFITVTPLKCSGYYKDENGDLIVLVWQTGQRNQNGTTYNVYNVWEKVKGTQKGVFYRVQGLATTIDNAVIDVKKDILEGEKPFTIDQYPVRMIELSTPPEVTEAAPPKYNSISKQLQTAYNLDNMTIKGMNNVCFSPMTYQTQTGEIPKANQIGDNNVLGYAEGLQPPARMKVETSHFDTQEAKYQAILTSIRKQMDSYTQISDNSSGEARKEAGRKIIQYWQQIAKEATEHEQWAYSTVQENYINSNEEVMVNYSTDFSSLTPDVVLENVLSLMDTFQLSGSEAEKLLYENTVGELYGDDPIFTEKLQDAFKQRTNNITGTSETIEEDDIVEE